MSESYNLTIQLDMTSDTEIKTVAGEPDKIFEIFKVGSPLRVFGVLGLAFVPLFFVVASSAELTEDFVDLEVKRANFYKQDSSRRSSFFSVP